MGNAVWTLGEYSILGSGQNSGKPISGHFAPLITQDGTAWRWAVALGYGIPVGKAGFAT